jgi:2-C-methyl-D-erythritol 4-phosphate cytidylyltransferase
MNSLVIVAGGSGSRMESEIPKQFMEINGKPLILWTIDKFLLFDNTMKVIVVLPENHLIVWQALIKKHPEYKRLVVTSGGATRFHSVRRGLEHISENEVVGIHDAVRPLVSVETISRCFEMAAMKNSAIPVIDMEDSLRTVSARGNAIVDRSNIKRVQTPQVFIAEKLVLAYENCLEKNFTDDASVFESYYGGVQLVEGNKENIKITYPGDLKFAESLLA